MDRDGVVLAGDHCGDDDLTVDITPFYLNPRAPEAITMIRNRTVEQHEVERKPLNKSTATGIDLLDDVISGDRHIIPTCCLPRITTMKPTAPSGSWSSTMISSPANHAAILEKAGYSVASVTDDDAMAILETEQFDAWFSLGRESEGRKRHSDHPVEDTSSGESCWCVIQPWAI